MATANLDIPDIQANQDQKEVTANAAHNLLDLAMNTPLTFPVTGSGSFGVNDTKQNSIIVLTGTPGAPFTLNMPDTNNRTLAIRNETDAQCTVRNSAAGGARQPVIPVGTSEVFHYDGTDFRHLGSDIEEVSHFEPGVVAVTTLLFLKVVTRDVRMNDEFAGSQAFAVTAPGGGTAPFDVERNGAVIGTLTFAAASQVATFTTVAATDEVWVTGDRIGIRSQAALNGIADVSFNLLTTRI